MAVGSIYLTAFNSSAYQKKKKKIDLALYLHDKIWDYYMATELTRL